MKNIVIFGLKNNFSFIDTIEIISFLIQCRLDDKCRNFWIEKQYWAKKDVKNRLSGEKWISL